jgi:hypothetical protein
VWIAAERRWPARAAALLGAAVCLVGLIHLTFPVLRFERDATLARTHGWRELKALGSTGAKVAYAENFGLASEVAFQARLPVAVTGASRLTQFDFWPEPPLEDGEDAVFVSEWGEPPPEKLAQAFQLVEGPKVVRTSYRGRPVHEFRYWLLRGKKTRPDRERPVLPR